MMVRKCKSKKGEKKIFLFQTKLNLKAAIGTTTFTIQSFRIKKKMKKKKNNTNSD